MNQINYSALGERIRCARRKKKITQETLGEICSLSAAHIGHIERGTRIPSVETLFKISNALGVSTDQLLFDSQNDTNGTLISIASILREKDEAKARTYITTIKAILENIDDL